MSATMENVVARVEEHSRPTIDRILKHIAAVPAMKLEWPKDFPGQATALKGLVDRVGQPMTAAQAAKFFKRAPIKQVSSVIESMARVGMIFGYDSAAGRMYLKHAAGR